MKKLLFALFCATFSLVSGQAGAYDHYQDDVVPNVSIPPVVIRCPTTNGNVLGNCPGFGQGATVTTAQVSCAITATSLLPASTTSTKRLVSNVSGSTVFLGGAGVTTATGWALPTGTTLDVSSFSGQLFCIAAAPTTVSTLSY